MPDALLFVLSPAKALDMGPSSAGTTLSTQPRMERDGQELVKLMQQKSAADLCKLSGLSSALGELNRGRWKGWETQPRKQACTAFDGPAYRGLRAETFSAAQQAWAQGHVRLLSGLYGALRPYDAIRPYRLEMGTKLRNSRGADLYGWWGDQIAKALTADLVALKQQGRKVVVNCASQEYFKAVRVKGLGAGVDVVTCDFPGPSVFAKRARGMMVRYAVQTGATSVEALKGFRGYGDDGYAFSAAKSSATKLVFIRGGKGAPDGAPPKGAPAAERKKGSAKKGSAKKTAGGGKAGAKASGKKGVKRAAAAAGGGKRQRK